jgi:uncharacterized alkaline shock family protein YloU
VSLFDRVVLTFYTFALLFISALAVAMAVSGWTSPLETALFYLRRPESRWAVGAVGAVFFLVSARLLYLAFRRRPSAAVVHSASLGEVRISLGAVENLVSRVARGMKGVRDVRVGGEVRRERLYLSLRLEVGPEVAIPELADALQKEVARQVRQVVGTEVAGVSVQIKDIVGRTRLE